MSLGVTQLVTPPLAVVVLPNTLGLAILLVEQALFFSL